ncbi:MAG: ABC transporter permease [Firmicutes bacterium]|nr:ABC transporter permease [Bacillota bacterium]
MTDSHKSPLGTGAGLGRTVLERYSIALVFLGFVVVASLISPYFLTLSNVQNILVQVADVGIIAIGQTFVILTGGIDLSVGSMVAMISVLAVSSQGYGVLAEVAVALLLGLAAGTVNGLMVTKGRVAPFVATLAMMAVAKGVALWYTNGEPIYGNNNAFQWIGNGSVLGIATPIVLLVLCYVLAQYALVRTPMGRYVLATGGNKEAARLSGVNVTFYETLVYVLSGLTTAIGALIVSSRMNTGSPIAGNGYELDAIAAVVIGGSSLFGGRGNFIGTLFGVLILGIIGNILNLMNVSPYIQYLARGIIIAAAVLLQRRDRQTA